MTPLKAFLSGTVYAVATDFGTDGIASGGDMTANWDDACNAWVEQLSKNRRESAVIEINLPDGTSRDVTDAARATVAGWNKYRWESTPDWFEENAA